MNKRIEHKLETEKKIFDVAMEEFAANGYEKARLQNIADKAGVAIGLIGAKFTNKMGLYERIVDYGCRYVKELNEHLHCADWQELCNQMINFLKSSLDSSETITNAFDFVFTMANSPDTPKYYFDVAEKELSDSIMWQLFKIGQSNNEIIDGDIYEIYRLFFRNAISVMHICNDNNLQIPSNEWFIKLISK